MLQWNMLIAVRHIDHDRMALAEGSPPAVLPAEPNQQPLNNEGCESCCLGGAVVQGGAPPPEA